MADHDEGESGHFYRCSEKDCYSPIEIISLDKENIEFKCFNPKGSHQIKMKLEDYLVIIKMNAYNNNYEKCKIHYKEIESYCIDCNKHLCKVGFESREHLSHNKINITEIKPTENEIKLIEKIMIAIEDKEEFQDLKNLYDIIYGNYKKYSTNYYHSINLNFIIVNYIESNKSLKEKLSKEEYENIIKIKNRKQTDNKFLINNSPDKIENYEKKINILKDIINGKEIEISNLKKDNIKLIEEINEFNDQRIINQNLDKINEKGKIKEKINSNNIIIKKKPEINPLKERVEISPLMVPYKKIYEEEIKKGKIKEKINSNNIIIKKKPELNPLKEREEISPLAFGKRYEEVGIFRTFDPSEVSPLHVEEYRKKSLYN